jgi:hypothetical protein
MIDRVFHGAESLVTEEAGATSMLPETSGGAVTTGMMGDPVSLMPFISQGDTEVAKDSLHPAM